MISGIVYSWGASCSLCFLLFGVGGSFYSYLLSIFERVCCLIFWKPRSDGEGIVVGLFVVIDS